MIKVISKLTVILVLFYFIPWWGWVTIALVCALIRYWPSKIEKNKCDPLYGHMPPGTWDHLKGHRRGAGSGLTSIDDPYHVPADHLEWKDPSW